MSHVAWRVELSELIHLCLAVVVLEARLSHVLHGRITVRYSWRRGHATNASIGSTLSCVYSSPVDKGLLLSAETQDTTK